MNSDEVLRHFKETEALLEGHFILRSGLHSRHFFQCAILLQHTAVAEKLCKELAGKTAGLTFDAVISPAVGGIIVGQEVARALGLRHIFAEKDDGKLVLRRGFQIRQGERFLVAEDVVTQGGRVRETMDIVRANGGVVGAVATLVHRGDSDPDFGCPFHSLLRLKVEAFEPDKLPPDLAATPGVKHGSK